MRRFLSVLAILCAPVLAHDKKPPAPPPPPSEPARQFWLKPDNAGGKDAHLGISAVIGAGLRFNDPSASYLDRAGRCFAVGVGKELLDYAMGSGVSKSDLKYDALGCMAGVAIGSGLLYVTRDRGEVRVSYSVQF